ncbi:MAG: hypothetical protein ACYDA0_00500 [Candidatus Dormibacteraceae bacterium]
MELKPVFASPKTGSERCESRWPTASSLYRRMGEVFREVAAVVALIGIASGCTIGAPSTFTLNSASVDATYTCPAGAANAPYNLNATIDVRNSTSGTVTIKSVAAVLTLVAVKGSWLERVGDKYEAAGVTVSPQTVGAGSSTSLKVTVPSACTNGKTPSAGTNYGDYSVLFTIATTSGTHTIESQNRHRLVAA